MCMECRCRCSGESKPEDYKTKVPLEWIEKDLRRVLSRAGISDEAIRVQEIGDYWRQKGKEFLIGKQLDIRFTDFEKINAVIKKIDTKGIESMRIGELKHKDLPNYRKQGKIEALKAAREVLILFIRHRVMSVWGQLPLSNIALLNCGMR